MEGDQALVPGRLNRSQLEYYEAGGKGINVSIVLNNLGIPSRAFGFLGGFTKDFYISLLAKYEFILPNFTYTSGNTRINVKLHAGEEATDVNAAGPYVTDADMKNLAEKVSRLDKGDYLVLAGNTQQYLEDDVRNMLEKAIESGVKVCMDTDPDLVKQVIGKGIFLLKTTPEELSRMIDQKAETEEEVLAGAVKLHGMGAENVLVVIDNRMALLVCHEGCYTASLEQETKAIYTLGTGDSLVAGFIMDYLRSKDPVDSFRFGCSCGSATAYSRGLATREKIDSFYDKTEVSEVQPPEGTVL
jgi:1-phosphofructokinase